MKVFTAAAISSLTFCVSVSGQYHTYQDYAADLTARDVYLGGPEDANYADLNSRNAELWNDFEDAEQIYIRQLQRSPAIGRGLRAASPSGIAPTQMTSAQMAPQVQAAPSNGRTLMRQNQFDSTKYNKRAILDPHHLTARSAEPMHMLKAIAKGSTPKASPPRSSGFGKGAAAAAGPPAPKSGYGGGSYSGGGQYGGGSYGGGSYGGGSYGGGSYSRG